MKSLFDIRTDLLKVEADVSALYCTHNDNEQLQAAIQHLLAALEILKE